MAAQGVLPPLGWVDVEGHHSCGDDLATVATQVDVDGVNTVAVVASTFTTMDWPRSSEAEGDFATTTGDAKRGTAVLNPSVPIGIIGFQLQAVPHRLRWRQNYRSLTR